MRYLPWFSPRTNLTPQFHPCDKFLNVFWNDEHSNLFKKVFHLKVEKQELRKTQGFAHYMLPYLKTSTALLQWLNHCQVLSWNKRFSVIGVLKNAENCSLHAWRSKRYIINKGAIFKFVTRKFIFMSLMRIIQLRYIFENTKKVSSNNRQPMPRGRFSKLLSEISQERNHIHLYKDWHCNERNIKDMGYGIFLHL